MDRIPTLEGSVLELDRVLVLGDGEDVTVGTPIVEGAKVVAKSLGEQKDDKIIIFRYKNKSRYRKKTGHRQTHTRLEIDRILKPGEKVEPVKRARRTRKAVATKSAASSETAATEVTESGS